MVFRNEMEQLDTRQWFWCLDCEEYYRDFGRRQKQQQQQLQELSRFLTLKRADMMASMPKRPHVQTHKVHH